MAGPAALGVALCLVIPSRAGGGPLDPPRIQTPPRGGIIHSGTPLVSGTATAGALVTIRIDGSESGTARADDQGTWRHVPRLPLAAGGHQAVASVQDGGGATSDSGPADFTVVPGLPDAPVVLVPGEGARVSRTDPGFVFGGSAEAGTTARIQLDGEDLPGQAEVTLVSCEPLPAASPEGGCFPLGLWSFPPAAEPGRGAHTVRAYVVEPGGAAGLPCEPVRFTVIGFNYYAFGCSAAPPGILPRWALLLFLGLTRRRPPRVNRPAPPGHPRLGGPWT
jgi:hypothetical protein